MRKCSWRHRLSSLCCPAGASSNGARILLDVQGVTLCTPNRAATLVHDLSFQASPFCCCCTALNGCLSTAPVDAWQDLCC